VPPSEKDQPAVGRFGRSGHARRPPPPAGNDGRADPTGPPVPATATPPAPVFDPTTYYRPREPLDTAPTRERDVGFVDERPTTHLPSVPNGPRAGDRASRPQPTRPYESVDVDAGVDVDPGHAGHDRDPRRLEYRAAAAPLDQATTVAPVTTAGAVPKVTVTRAVAARSSQAAQTVARRVVAASRANGASESGLTPLIWNQVLSFGADAMVTVALAGTVFFSAAQSDQKGNVLSYLLITMAPFAVVAPVIGPVLDRFQHGRRWAMAASGFGRALLAVLMAQNFNNLLLLFPLALGSLVLSKAYSVVRAAAAPRVVPADMTLVTANARLSIFGLGAAVVGGGFIAGVVRVTGSYPLGLWLTAIAFAVTGFYSLRLPAQVDSAVPARSHPEEPRRPPTQGKVPALHRIRGWVSRGFDAQVITSMQGESALRWSAGFLTMFLAFYIEKTAHGFQAASSLGAVGAAVAVGNLIGTGSGARFAFRRPHVIVLSCSAINAVACVLTALSFNLETAVAAMAVCSATNSLGKLSLDAVIQRDVAETLRSSAFARSETFLQLAWVVGAAVALLLPADRGTLGMSVAGTVLAVSVIYIGLRARVGVRAARGRGTAPGNV
jgi:MFS family permease